MALVLSSPAFSKHNVEIAELAVKHGLPTMFTFKHYVDGGGNVLWRRISDDVAADCGLRGANSQRRKTGRLANRTAHQIRVNSQSQDRKALGVTIPNGILLAADEVIE